MAEQRTSGRVLGRCARCGASGREVSGTFCGRCGAALQPVARPESDHAAPSPWDEPSPPEAGQQGVASPPEATRPPSRGGALRRVMLLIGLAVVAAVAGLARDGETPRASDIGPGAPTADAGSGRPAELTPAPPCVPPGCALWTVDVGDAGVAAAGNLFVVVEGGSVAAHSMADGELRWFASLVDDDATRRFNIRSITVDDGLLLLQTVGSGRLQAVDPATGAAAWTRDLPEVFVVHARRAGDLLVVAGRTTQAAGVDEHERIQALDVATGVTRWHRDVHEVITVDGTILVVRTTDANAAGLDARTGEVVWEVSGVGSTRVSASSTTVAVSSPERTELVDRTSGAVVGATPWGWSDEGHPSVHGDVVVARSSGQQDTARLRVVDRFGNTLLEPQVGRWAGVAEVADVVVVGVQKGAQLLLVGMGADATLRWEEVLDLSTDDCCWAVRPAAGDDASILVTPPAVPGGRVLRLDPEGAVLQEYTLLPPGFPSPDISWHGLVTVFVQPDNSGALLAGPQGGVFLSGPPQVLSSRRPLVVRVADTVVSIDESRILADGIP